MKFRSFLYLLTAVVLVLLLIAGGGAYWIAATNPVVQLQSREKAKSGADIFVSRQSPLVLSLLINPDRLEAVEVAAASPEKRRSLRAGVNRFRQSLLGKTPLNYQRDIQPWLGDEATLAITTADIDRNQVNGQQPGYLIALAIRDPELAQASIRKFWQRQASGKDLVFEQFAGVQLIYAAGKEAARTQRQIAEKTEAAEATTEFAFTSAVVSDRFVLFANQPKVLRDALNNLQVPELSLSRDEAFQEAFERLPAQQVGFAYVNLPQLSAWLTEKPDRISSQPRLYKSLLASLKFDSQGLLADTVLLPGAEAPNLVSAPPALSAPVEALRYIPASSGLAIAGTDLQQFWTQLEAGLTGYDSLAIWLKQPLDNLQQQWGIDLPEDLFSWVQRDYALALLPGIGSSQPDWIFVTRKSEASDAGLDQLNAIAQQQGTSIGSVMLDDQKISVWTRLLTQSQPGAGQKPGLVSVQAEVQGVRTTIGDYELFATSLEALEQAIQAPQAALNASAEFQQAIAPLKQPNNGYLYLDWPILREVIKRGNLPRLKAVATQSFLDNLRSLAISSYGSDKAGQQSGIFLRLNDF